MQLLHSASDLQDGGGGVFQVSQFKKLWRHLFHEEFKKIAEPVLSRWWTVGQGAIDVRPSFHKWKVMSKKMCDAYPSIAAPNKCGSALLDLLAEPAIISHVEWIAAFNEAIWNEKYVWLTDQDETTKKPGFRIQHMAAFTILVQKGLSNMSNNWKDNDHFLNYLNAKESVESNQDQNYLKVF